VDAASDALRGHLMVTLNLLDEDNFWDRRSGAPNDGN
jgi:hypothetical protein